MAMLPKKYNATVAFLSQEDKDGTSKQFILNMLYGKITYFI